METMLAPLGRHVCKHCRPKDAPTECRGHGCLLVKSGEADCNYGRCQVKEGMIPVVCTVPNLPSAHARHATRTVAAQTDPRIKGADCNI